MNRTISYCLFISVATVLAVLTISDPQLLSNGNEFLQGFMPHEFLAIVGVMLTITLASAAQVHLTLNEIEEKRKGIFFAKTRATVRSAAYWLIGLFLGCIVLVLSRPFVIGHVWAESALNSIGIFLLFWTTLIMLSLTQLIFAIKPDIPRD